MKHSKSIDVTLATSVIALGIVVSLALLVFLRDFNDNNHRPSPSKPSSIGTIVEVYNKEDSYFAIPAIITDEIISISTSPSSSNDVNGNDASATSYRSYNLQNSITNEIMTNVNEEHIHPYTPYKDGTIASCNFSTLRNKVHLMTPCAIVSSSSTVSSTDASSHDDVEVEDDTKSNSGKITVSYQVAYLNEENILSYVNDLPYNRVQRRRHLHFPYKIQ